jgi:hypothetical protein
MLAQTYIKFNEKSHCILSATSQGTGHGAQTLPDEEQEPA